MCEKGQRLRVLVNERLTAAAQEIFALFERTIAEYEEELCRSKEENKRKQQLLDSVLSPRVLLHRTDVQIQTVSLNIKEEEKHIRQSPESAFAAERRQTEKETEGEDFSSDPQGHLGPETVERGVQIQSMSQEEVSLKQENTEESPQIKEEPEENLSMKEEEEGVQVFTEVSEKREKQFQQIQTEENREKTETESNLEPHLQSETEEQTENSSDTDNDDDWIQPMDVNKKDTDKDPTAQKSNPYFMFKRPAAKKTPLNPHECIVCKKRFRDVCDLQSHTKVHTGQKPFSCSQCDGEFTRKHTSREHICSPSGQKVETKKSHGESQRQRKLLTCPVCKKGLRWTYFKDHMRTHSGDRPYSCSVCTKAFTQKCNLNSHMRTHNGDRPFSCSECDARFTRKITLQNHMFTHSGEKPHRCSVCDKSFALLKHLKTHLRTHTGERPFSCSQCDTRFAMKITLQNHMFTHSGEKPHSCSVCDKSFAFLKHLNRHMKTHTGERPFSCSVCTKTFTQKYILNSHMKRHKGETKENLVVK